MSANVVVQTATVDRRSWDSWQEWVDSAESDPTDCPPDRRSSRDHSEWAGGDLKTALRLARSGWPEGLARVEHMSMTLSDQLGSRISRPMPTTDIVGDSVDVPAYLAGVPDCMVTWEQSEHAGKLDPIVRIGLNICVSSALDHDVIFRKGAAIIALADALEQAGMRAEIDMTLGSGRKDAGHVFYSVTLKRPDAPLQMDQLAFALCHAGSLRLLGFSVMETAPKSVRHAVGIGDSGYGYGMPMDLPQDYDVYIGASTYGERQWDTDETTQAWIIEQLKKQGVEIS